MNQLPVGPPISMPKTLQSPQRRVYQGKIIKLAPLDPSNDAPALFWISNGSPEVEQLWTYMAYGPFTDPNQMADWMKGLTQSKDPLFLTVHHHQLGPVGMVSFLNVVPKMLRLELGNIWYLRLANRRQYRGGLPYAVRRIR